MAKHRDKTPQNYRYRTSFTTRERLAGGFVLAAIAVLAALVLSSESLRDLREDWMIVHGRVATAEGVGPDTLVTLSGVKVGAVSATEITPENDIRITIRIASRFRSRLRADASAELTTLALFGKTQIDIKPGSPAAPALGDGGELTIHKAPPLDHLIARMGPTLTTVQAAIDDLSTIIAAVEPASVRAIVDRAAGVGNAVDPDVVRGIVDDAGNIAADLRALTARLEAGEGALGALLSDGEVERDVRNGVRQLDATLEIAGATLGEVRARVVELQPVIADASAIGAKTREIGEQLPHLVGSVQSAVDQVNLTLTTLNTELQQLPDLTLRLKLLLDETNRTLEGMQRVWPLSSAVKRPAARSIAEPLPLNE